MLSESVLGRASFAVLCWKFILNTNLNSTKAGGVGTPLVKGSFCPASGIQKPAIDVAVTQDFLGLSVQMVSYGLEKHD